MSTLDTILGIPAEEQPRSAQQQAGTVVPSEPAVSSAASAQQDGDGGRRRMSYVEMMQQMSPYTPPTEEQQKKERRKQKRDMVLASIGNGLSAFHHAYTTATGQRSMVDPRVSLTGKVRDRYDKIQKERDAQRAAYNQAYMRVVMMDEEAGDKERRWQRQLGIDKAAADKAEKEQARKDAREEALRGKYEAAARKDDAMTAYWEAKAKAIEEGMPLDIAVKEARAAKDRALANKANGGGSGKPGEYPWYDKDGGIHYAHSYEAMRQNAIQHGTWNDVTQESVQRKQEGIRTTVTTTEKPAKGHSSKPQSAKSKFSIH